MVALRGGRTADCLPSGRCVEAGTEIVSAQGTALAGGAESRWWAARGRARPDRCSTCWPKARRATTCSRNRWTGSTWSWTEDGGAATAYSVTRPSMQVTTSPPTQMSSPAFRTCTRPARPSAVPCAAT